MANNAPDPAVSWVILTCPSCRSRSRVRAEAGPRGARCPNCGTAIRLARSESETRLKAAPAPAEDVDDPEEDEADRPDSPHWDERDIELPRRPNPYWLMWRGVYGFPWHLNNLVTWFLNGIGFSLVALFLAVVHWVGESGLPWQLALAFLKGAVWFLLWTGAYACGVFLAAIQQTAVGHERVKATDESIKEKALGFVYVAWMVVYASILMGLVLFPLKWYVGTRIFLWGAVPAVIFVFPWVLLGGLTNGSAFAIWNREIAVRVFRHPLTVLTLYFASALLLLPCLVLGYLTIGWLQYYLVPPTGFVWAACLLIYGRLLGRVGYILTEADLNAPRRKKLKKLPIAGRRH